MFHLQKAFEKSLRASSYERPPIAASGTSPLKPEIHRGCSGKAHACGTLKNKKPEPPKHQRKSSVSSETISDSGSEGSSLNSDSTKRAAQRRSQTPSRRRTTDVVVGVDEPDKAVVPARTRLHSDGDGSDKLIIPNGKRENLGTFQRSSSFRAPRVSVSPSPVRPPWNSNLGSKAAKQELSPKIEVMRPALRASLQPRHRGSFRRRNDGITWLNLWEQSFTQKMDGGSYKALDTLVGDKVSVSLRVRCGILKL